MNFSVYYDPAAQKDVKKLSRDLASRIMDKMDWFANQENPKIFAKSLSKPIENAFRFRVGNYRAVVEFSDNKILVLRVLDRREVYKKI